MSTEKVLRGEETRDKDVMMWSNRRSECANSSWPDNWNKRK